VRGGDSGDTAPDEGRAQAGPDAVRPGRAAPACRSAEVRTWRRAGLRIAVEGGWWLVLAGPPDVVARAEAEGGRGAIGALLDAGALACDGPVRWWPWGPCCAAHGRADLVPRAGRLGWPRARLAPLPVVLGGEDAWRRWVARAGPVDLAVTHRALRTQELAAEVAQLRTADVNDDR
jgi:hypothetical protein